MTTRSFPRLLGAALAIALSTPALAQNDPLTRFLDGLMKSEKAPAETVAPEASPAPAAAGDAVPRQRPTARREAAPQAAGEPRAVRKQAVAAPEGTPAPQKPALVDAPKPEPAGRLAASPSPAPAARPSAATPANALDRVNSYFNGIDQLTATFVQNNSNGQRSSGTLYLKRPGHLRFAYSPPSTLEVVSDGRSVAVRDRKLGTNDVYPVGQTPLKFLLQEQFKLERDTKVRDVQVGSDGMVTVRFEDSATFGGTSRITLRFDSRANELKQWSVVDPQGYETTVVLSNLEVVAAAGARAAN
jgi:outer membrane lipoprotein-sorting protein